MENKTGKYLKYAIGEIILVVIGILIAVQINSFNNNSSLKKSNKLLLTRMISEINDNVDRLKYLEFDSLVYTKVYKTASYAKNQKQLKASISITNNLITDDNLAFLIKNSNFNWSRYNLFNSVHHEMLNTGKMYTIGSATLVSEISKYYKLIDQQDAYNNTQIQSVINDFNNCNYGWNNFKKDYNIDKELAIKNNVWLFNKQSKNYIDYRTYLYNALAVLSRSRERITSINKASEKLIILINKTVIKN